MEQSSSPLTTRVVSPVVSHLSPPTHPPSPLICPLHRLTPPAGDRSGGPWAFAVSAAAVAARDSIRAQLGRLLGRGRLVPPRARRRQPRPRVAGVLVGDPQDDLVSSTVSRARRVGDKPRVASSRRGARGRRPRRCSEQRGRRSPPRAWRRRTSCGLELHGCSVGASDAQGNVVMHVLRAAPRAHAACHMQGGAGWRSLTGPG